MKQKIKIAIFTIFVTTFFIASGCSVYKAVDSPPSRDFSILEKGTDRYSVIAELGEPLLTEAEADGTKVDIFKFVQGQHGLFKGVKALGYGVLAVTTLGLSEIVTTPLEGAAGSGAEMQIKVVYNANNAVTDVEILKDGRWLRIQKTTAEDDSIENSLSN